MWIFEPSSNFLTQKVLFHFKFQSECFGDSWRQLQSHFDTVFTVKPHAAHKGVIMSAGWPGYLTARWECGSTACSPGWAAGPEGCSWCPREACWESGWRGRPGGAGSTHWGDTEARGRGFSLKIFETFATKRTRRGKLKRRLIFGRDAKKIQMKKSTQEKRNSKRLGKVIFDCWFDFSINHRHEKSRRRHSEFPSVKFSEVARGSGWELERLSTTMWDEIQLKAQLSEVWIKKKHKKS